MNDCTDGNMRDQLPDLAHGTLSPARRQAVAAHVATCADCAAEIELIRIAARAFGASRVDTARIVRALPATSRGTRWAFAGSAQRIAAAIGIVVIGAVSTVVVSEWGRSTSAPVQSKALSAPVSTLAATPPAATRTPPAAVIDSPAPAPKAAASVASGHPAMSFGGGLSDLSDDELDTLLSELDGLDALPSTEPETHLTPILPPGDGGHGAR